MKEYWILLKTFFLIGSMTFGGGYTVLPILMREIVQKKQWLTEEELLDYFSLSQCTPGVICVNISTFLGYRKKGILGAVTATFGVILPSLIIITIVAAVLQQFIGNPWVEHAFAGIRVAVGALIASTVWTLWKRNIKSWLKALIAIIAFIAVGLIQVSPIYISLGFAVFGAFFFGRKQTA